MDYVFLTAGSVAGHLLGVYSTPFLLFEILRWWQNPKRLSGKKKQGLLIRDGFCHNTELTTYESQRIPGQSDLMLYSKSYLDLRKGPVLIKITFSKAYKSLSLFGQHLLNEQIMSSWDLTDEDFSEGNERKEMSILVVGSGYELLGKDQHMVDKVWRTTSDLVLLIQRLITTDSVAGLQLLRKGQKMVSLEKPRRGTFIKPSKAHVTWKTYTIAVLVLLYGAFLKWSKVFGNPFQNSSFRWASGQILSGLLLGALSVIVLVVIIRLDFDAKLGIAKNLVASQWSFNTGAGKPEEHKMWQLLYYSVKAPLALAGSEVVYLWCQVDNKGDNLMSNKKYRITIPESLPARWWSFTCYNDRGWLMDNPFGKYGTDCTKMGWKIGQSEHEPAVPSPEAKRVIILSDGRPTDRSLAWIPIGGKVERLKLVLRFYKPTRELKTVESFGDMPIVEILRE